MSFIILISIFIIFFVIIWGLTYKFHKSSFKIVTWLIWTASFVILGASAFWTAVDALDFRAVRAFGMNLEGMSNALGTFSFLWGLAAVFVFFSKRLYHRLHMNNTNDVDIVRRILLLAKNQHNLFGWVTLAAATAHGVYFLFHAPNHWADFYTGIAAWAALVLLAISGIWIGKTAKVPKRAKFIRGGHITLTAGYAGAIILHFRGSIFIAAFLFVAAFIAMAIMWGFVRLAQSLKSQ